MKTSQFLLVACLLTACAADRTYPFERCTDETVQPLGMDEATEFGPTPRQLYAEVTGTVAFEFDVVSGVLRDSFPEPMWAERTIEPDTSRPDHGILQLYTGEECTPYVRLPVDVQLGFPEAGIDVVSFGGVHVWDPADPALWHLGLVEPTLTIHPDGPLDDAVNTYDGSLDPIWALWMDPINQGPFHLVAPLPGSQTVLTMVVTQYEEQPPE